MRGYKPNMWLLRFTLQRTNFHCWNCIATSRKASSLVCCLHNTLVKHTKAYLPAHKNRLTMCRTSAVCSSLQVHITHSSLQSLDTSSGHTPLSRKRYTEKENAFAHSVMEALPAYKNGIVLHPATALHNPHKQHLLLCKKPLCDSSSSSTSKPINLFYNLSLENANRTMNLEDPKHTELVMQLVSDIRSFSYIELVHTLEALCMWPTTESRKTPHFYMLVKALDTRCTQLVDSLDTDKLLLLADYWYHLHLGRMATYNSKMISRVAQLLDALSISQLVQLLFFINLRRTVSSHIMQRVEQVVMTNLKDLEMDELGIICMGFFKTQTKFKNPRLISEIIRVMSGKLGSINELTLSSILKQLRYSGSSSTGGEHTTSLDQLFQKCLPHVPQWSPLVLTHLSLLGVAYNLYTPMLCEVIALSATKKLDEMRLKDISKVLFCLGYFHHIPNMDADCLNAFVQELRRPGRRMEIASHPSSFVSSLLHLSYLGAHPEDQLATALGPDFVRANQQSFERHGTFRELIALDCNVEIECPSFKHPRFNRKEYIQGVTTLLGRIPNHALANLTEHEKLTLDVADMIQEASQGKLGCRIAHLLPHYHAPDILVHDISISREELSFLPTNLQGTVVHPPPRVKWTAVVICGKAHHSYFDMKPVGAFVAKVRQLRLLRYRVIEVPWFCYSKLSKDEKVLYLKEAIKF